MIMVVEVNAYYTRVMQMIVTVCYQSNFMISNTSSNVLMHLAHVLVLVRMRVVETLVDVPTSTQCTSVPFISMLTESITNVEIRWCIP